mgnify:CR=1 FL=1
MKRVYLVEWGALSSMGALDNPWFQKFDDLEKATRFYDSIKIRDKWIVEYNTTHHMSRDRACAKTLSSSIDHDGWIYLEQVLQYDTYGLTEHRMERQAQ